MTLDYTLRSFVFSAENLAGLPKGLAVAVIKQCGGWKPFKKCALDFPGHGVYSSLSEFIYDGNLRGFVFYQETVEFAKKYRALIAELAESEASDQGFGTTAIELVQDLNYFKNDRPSQAIVGRCLYGDAAWGDDEISVMNALAWYAAEEVLRAYSDYVEQQGGEE